MCNCSSFRENCVTHARTHARTHAHGANYDLPLASRAGDKKTLSPTEALSSPMWYNSGISTEPLFLSHWYNAGTCVPLNIMQNGS